MKEVPLETLEELMDALHFYSEPQTWSGMELDSDTDATLNDGHKVPGAKARAILAKLREERAA